MEEGIEQVSGGFRYEFRLGLVTIYGAAIFALDSLEERNTRAEALDMMRRICQETDKLRVLLDGSFASDGDSVVGGRGRVFVSGDLVVDYGAEMVCVGGSVVHLTPTEYRLPRELSVHAGLVLTHGHLLENVWGPGYEGSPELVRTYVNGLRKKLGDDAGQPRYIFTMGGVGYWLQPPG